MINYTQFIDFSIGTVLPYVQNILPNPQSQYPVQFINISAWQVLILNQNLKQAVIFISGACNSPQARQSLQFIIMLHSRFKLIHNPATIVIDRRPAEESDIDEEEDNVGSQAAMKALQNSKKKGSTSLLVCVSLKGRRQAPPQAQIKQEAVIINDDNEDDWLQQQEGQSESQSLVFIKKKTNPECLKKKLRRLATVPNKVKLEGRDQNSKECSICLGDLKQLEEKDIGRLSCKHTFCYTCILESSKFSNRCPYCRATFTSIRHGKRVKPVEEARLNEEFDDPLDQPCYICGRNDDFERLLECEYCQYAYCHTYCDNRLNSDQPPVGHWYCLSCEELLRNQINIVDEDQEEEIFEDQS